MFFNKFIIGKVYHYIVDIEKISNKTNFNVSFAQKLAVALFLNTAGTCFYCKISYHLCC